MKNRKEKTWLIDQQKQYKFIAVFTSRKQLLNSNLEYRIFSYSREAGNSSEWPEQMGQIFGVFVYIYVTTLNIYTHINLYIIVTYIVFLRIYVICEHSPIRRIIICL